jgi:hypothetical protein
VYERSINIKIATESQKFKVKIVMLKMLRAESPGRSIHRSQPHFQPCPRSVYDAIRSRKLHASINEVPDEALLFSLSQVDSRLKLNEPLSQILLLRRPASRLNTDHSHMTTVMATPNGIPNAPKKRVLVVGAGAAGEYLYSRSNTTIIPNSFIKECHAPIN